MDRKRVNLKAQEVNRISLQFHLAHASLACETIIQGELQKKFRKELSDIQSKKKNAQKRNDIAAFGELCQQEVKLEKRNTVRIYIEYIKGLEINKNSGRVVFHNNHFIINIPEALLNDSVGEGYLYTESAKKLREIMAHELGHIVLHYEEIMKKAGTQGTHSVEFKGCKDEEAKAFSEELLRLRAERNNAIINNNSFRDIFA